MKQLLFLLLFPCLCVAQYTGNAGQKITLGEQTTADGLVWRGRLADTANLLTNKLDTSVYIVLDTGTRAMWYYRASTTPKWTRLVDSLNNMQGQLSLTTKVTGTLPVANGGTNASTFNAGSVVFAGASGTSLTQDNSNLFWDDTNNRLGIGTSSPSYPLSIINNTSMVNATNYIPFNNTTINSVTSNIQSYQIGTQYTVRQNVATGSTNDGYLMGMDLDVTTYTGSSGFSGTLTGLYGQRFHFGNESGGGNAPTITTAYGLYLRPFYGAGTISNLYALFIGDDQTGGTVTNNFGIYQETSNVKNYFNGNVGIGTESPLSKLNVMGTVRINSASAPDANFYLQLEDNGAQKAKAREWATYSDTRVKTDIQPIVNAIDKVNLLNPVYYQKHDSYVENDFLNIDYDSSVKSLGFIAQEVYNVIPEAVNTGTTNELWAMDYTKIIPILTKAIQEQNALIKALEQRIINLENK